MVSLTIPDSCVHLLIEDHVHRSLDEVFEAGLDKFPYKYYTAQHYPNHACDGYNDRNTNLTYYSQHSNGMLPTDEFLCLLASQLMITSA